MSIKIVKDPANPLGGYAKVIIGGLSVGAPASAHVRITRLEDDQYLSAAGWSTNDAKVGPFELSEENGAHTLILGPDVVGQMAPFQQIRVEVLEAGVDGTLKWPEDVATTQRTARRGTVHARKVGIGKVSPGRPAQPAPTPPGGGTPPPRPPEPPSPPVQPTPEPTTPPVPEPEPVPGPVNDPKPDDGQTEKPKSKVPLILGVLGLLLVLGGAGAYFGMSGDEPKTEETPVVEQEEKPAEATQSDTASGTCDPAGVQGAAADERWAMAQSCITEGNPQSALQLVEALVAEAYPEAQLQLGKWMDPNLDGDNPMGSKNANTAIRLYDSAKKAGLSEADPLSEALCKVLESATGLSEQVTHEKFCQGS